MENQKSITLAQTGAYAFSRDLLGIGTFTILTALAAQWKVYLPFTPVPVTAQSLVVVMAGLMLGAKRGALSQAAYAGLGAVGAPFFAALTPATAGYIAGFIPAAWLAGTLTARLKNPTFLKVWLAAFVATLPIFGLGALWLKTFNSLSWASAFALGVVPFMIGNVIKTTIAASAFRLAKRGGKNG